QVRSGVDDVVPVEAQRVGVEPGVALLRGVKGGYRSPARCRHKPGIRAVAAILHFFVLVVAAQTVAQIPFAVLGEEVAAHHLRLVRQAMLAAICGGLLRATVTKAVVRYGVGEMLGERVEGSHLSDLRFVCCDSWCNGAPSSRL